MFTSCSHHVGDSNVACTMSKFVLSSQENQGIVASSTIYSGETIVEELPLVSSQYLWNAEYKYDACQLCLTPLETAEENVRRLTGDSSIVLPNMEQCCNTSKNNHVLCNCGERYCSAQCRDQAWTSHHQSLCPSNSSNPSSLGQWLKQLCECWQHIHYPPETASIMLLVKLLAMIKQADNPSNLMSTINQLATFTEDTVERLSTLIGVNLKPKIAFMREMVARIVNCENSCLDTCFTEQGFLTLLLLISRHSQGIGTSAFSKWARNCETLVANDANECDRINKLVDRLFEQIEEHSGQFIDCEGSGIYLWCSRIRHSCAPNAEVCFPYNNHRLVVKAIDQIESGEEIYVCYFDKCMQNRSRHSRVKYLRENYFFNCQCSKCEAEKNEPDLTSEEEEGEEEESDLYSDNEDMQCD